MPKSKSKKIRRELKKVKHTLKFLSHGPENKIVRAILASSSDALIKALSNAALNVQQNPRIKIQPAHRNLFSTYSRTFDLLSSRGIPIEVKRKFLKQQVGGAIPLIPILISAALSLGSGFINKIFDRGENNE
jgi:hypothetical protein